MESSLSGDSFVLGFPKWLLHSLSSLLSWCVKRRCVKLLTSVSVVGAPNLFRLSLISILVFRDLFADIWTVFVVCEEFDDKFLWVVGLGERLEVVLQQASLFQVLRFLASRCVLFSVDARVVQSFVHSFDYLFLNLIEMAAIMEAAHSIVGVLYTWTG